LSGVPGKVGLLPNSVASKSVASLAPLPLQSAAPQSPVTHACAFALHPVRPQKRPENASGIAASTDVTQVPLFPHIAPAHAGSLWFALVQVHAPITHFEPDGHA
jgi:hypothetical protein